MVIPFIGPLFFAAAEGLLATWQRLKANNGSR